MTIEIKQEDGFSILSLDGRIDSNTSNDLQDKISECFDEGNQILLDFKNVSYISSAGLRVLLMGQKNANTRKGTFELSNVSDQVMKILETVGFTKILTFR